MGKGISLIISKGGNVYDMTSLVESIKWAGRKGSSSRTLNVTLIDDDGYKHARSEIDVEQGHQAMFSYNDVELFRGIIMSQTQNSKKKMTFTAYDNGIYLANNKDTFCYENKTADAIFKDVCSRFGIPVGQVAACSYVIPELTKSKTTGWDAIADALSLDYDATGIRHYVSSDKGKISLLVRKDNILQWVIEVGQNMSSYSYTRSIEKVRTRVKLVSKEGTTLAEKSNPAMESKIGIFQEVDQPDESLTQPQITALAESTLQNLINPERTLDIDSVGIPEVISGIGVFIRIPVLGLERSFYVDSDTHTFQGNNHTMSLKLTWAGDFGLSTEEAPAEQKKDYKIGDIVRFAGGSHYVSSTASKAASTKLGAGPAKITHTAEGRAHPWHLVTEDWSQTHVWGWVDAGTFS